MWFTFHNLCLSKEHSQKALLSSTGASCMAHACTLKAPCVWQPLQGPRCSAMATCLGRAPTSPPTTALPTATPALGLPGHPAGGGLPLATCCLELALHDPGQNVGGLPPKSRSVASSASYVRKTLHLCSRTPPLQLLCSVRNGIANRTGRSKAVLVADPLSQRMAWPRHQAHSDMPAGAVPVQTRQPHQHLLP